MSRHPLEHDGGRGLEAEVGGNLGHQAGGNHGVFGVGTARHSMGYPVARGEAGHLRAHRLNRSGGFHSRGEGHLGRVQPGPVIGVDEIDAGGGDLDQHFAGTGRWNRNLAEHHNRFHA